VATASGKSAAKAAKCPTILKMPSFPPLLFNFTATKAKDFAVVPTPWSINYDKSCKTNCNKLKKRKVAFIKSEINYLITS